MTRLTLFLSLTAVGSPETKGNVKKGEDNKKNYKLGGMKPKMERGGERGTGFSEVEGDGGGQRRRRPWR